MMSKTIAEIRNQVLLLLGKQTVGSLGATGGQGDQGVQGSVGSQGYIAMGAQGAQGGPSRWCFACHGTNWIGEGDDFPPEIDLYRSRAVEIETAEIIIGNETCHFSFYWMRQAFRGNPFRCEPGRIRTRFRCKDCGFEWDEMSSYKGNYG